MTSFAGPVADGCPGMARPGRNAASPLPAGSGDIPPSSAATSSHLTPAPPRFLRGERHTGPTTVIIRTGCSSPVPAVITIGVGAWLVTRGLALAHDAAGNLPDSVLVPATPVRTFVHSSLVSLNQEWRGSRTGRQPLPAPYLGEIGIVLAGPVNIHPAGNTVPLLVGGLGATLRTFHAPTRLRPGRRRLAGSRYSCLRFYAVRTDSIPVPAPAGRRRRAAGHPRASQRSLCPLVGSHYQGGRIAGKQELAKRGPV